MSVSVSENQYRIECCNAICNVLFYIKLFSAFVRNQSKVRTLVIFYNRKDEITDYNYKIYNSIAIYISLNQLLYMEILM